MLRRSAAILAALALIGLATLASPASALTQTFTVRMTGSAEAPNPGDPDGFGIARFTINSETDRVCYVLYVRNIAPASAAHIHIAPPGEPGPIVVGLRPPTNGTSWGCITDSDADAILANPHNYYVNVHNTPFPGGAVRGQLA